ncbi:hypothetical protein [Egicoccus sp. AB-alg6-2]|uniref:hypothetical protein n=1 Tax=Egicoccus sp. AB-alg6-2 TaxID=3242692 RepID=UPI00359F0B40
MNRRASLPGADELFRSTAGRDERPRSERSRTDDSRPRARLAPAPEAESPEASGRVRHDQKITVYLTAQELLDLEQARLRLRADFDIAVDRGRIVREAIAELLQELYERGPDSAMVRRLS